MDGDRPPLRLIGYWEERGEKTPWVHPRQVVDPEWEIDRREKLVQYLRSGVRVHEMLGYSHCRMDDSIPDVQMGNAELTDGVYIWPEGLPVYVERFLVRLPSEFVEHAEACSFQIPPNLDAAELEERPIDSKLWTAWSAQYRTRFWRKLFGMDPRANRAPKKPDSTQVKSLPTELDNSRPKEPPGKKP